MVSQQHWVDELPGAAEAAQIDADFMRQLHEAVMAGRCSSARHRLTLDSSQEILDEGQRREVLARLERAQAARGAKLVRAAGEAVPVATAPAITPDTVWSGDYDTLISLFQIGMRRISLEFAYHTSLIDPCRGGTLQTMTQHARRNGRTHEQP